MGTRDGNRYIVNPAEHAHFLGEGYVHLPAVLSFTHSHNDAQQVLNNVDGLLAATD